MAFRGGRGRGRGRGGGRGFPVVRDEDGMAIIPKSRDGPPPLFPPMESWPMLPDLTLKDEQLVSKRRHLESAWNVSPYYIEKPRPKSVGIAAEIERYSDRYKLKLQTKRPPLGSVLKLSSAYFPAELLDQGNRARSKQTTESHWTLQALAGKNDLQRLDQMSKLEQKRLTDGDDKDEGDDKGEKKKTEGEDGDEDDEDEGLEDEEEDFGDDDYAQNFGFDDDEDYLDMDDGGGGDDVYPRQDISPVDKGSEVYLKFSEIR